MEKLTLRITDDTKIEFLLELLGELDFVEIDSYAPRKESIDKGLVMSEEAIKYGNVTTQQELEKEIHSWRKK
ncbi:MAG: hypothetical protein Roseis2KO_19000 [Roseivirga sp.]